MHMRSSESIGLTKGIGSDSDNNDDEMEDGWFFTMQ